MENVEKNMMNYYLLRNNHESGPYTLKELAKMPLLTTDLIWVNGESTSWKSPSEVDDLQGLAKTPEQVKRETKPAAPAADPSLKKSDRQFSDPSPASTPTGQQTVAGDPLPEPSFEALSKKYAADNSRKRLRKTQLSIGANLMGILILVIGIALSAFMIQKAIENIEQDTVIATADAREIGATASYISTSSQAAMAPSTAVAAVPFTTSAEALAAINETPSETVKEPAREEVAPSAPTPPPAPVTKKEPPVSKKEGRKEAVQKPAESIENPGNEEKADGNEPAEKDSTTAEKEVAEEKEIESKKSKPKLQLSANDYKVGFMGGISNLELSIDNPSQQAVSRAVVEVDYLKPNGKVVGTQKVEVAGLAPNASKKVPVPDNSRGVSVRYRVVNVELK